MCEHDHVHGHVHHEHEHGHADHVGTCSNITLARGRTSSESMFFWTKIGRNMKKMSKNFDFCKKRARRAGRHSKNKKKINDANIR